MAERPPILWVLSPSPRPRQGEESPSTYLKATRELPPTPWALSSSSGLLRGDNDSSTSQDTFVINVSRHLGDNSQDDNYIELESSYPVSKYEENDSCTSDGGVSIYCKDSDITAVQHAASASTAATLPAAVDLSNRSFPLATEATCNSRVEMVTKKLGNIHKQGARIRECNRELDRITAEVTVLSKDAIKFGSSNDTEWFVAHLVTLGEEKRAVSAILQRTAKKYRKSQGRIEKRRQKQSEIKGHQHGAR